MRKIEAIVFDKDGTLFDFQATWGAWSHDLLTEEAGGDGELIRALADALDYDLASRRFRPGSLVIASTVSEVADVLLSLLPGRDKDRLVQRMDERAATAPQIEAAPLRPFLTDLRREGLRLGVATNDSEIPARAHLERAGIGALFDFIAGYDSGHGAKPAPGQLLAFAAATGAAPGRTLMVGDSLHDLHAAHAAGMIPVAVLTGVAAAEDLAPAAEVVLDSIAEIPRWLGLRT